MQRYGRTARKMIDENLYYWTTLYVEVPEDDSDLYFIAQEGDRCDNLAYRFYNNPSYLWFIARINHLNTMNIPAGTELRIPISLEKAIGL